MDKQTLSGYGWIVIVTLVLAVLLALATPFGTYVGDGVTTVVNGFINTNAYTINKSNINTIENEWNNKFDKLNPYGIIPKNATYTVKNTGEILTAGDKFPKSMEYNDIYTYGDYQYILLSGGWGVYVIDKTKTTYGPILESINKINITRMEYAFQGCRNLVDASEIKIPKTIKTMLCTFDLCSKLEIPPKIPYGVISLQFTFQHCSKLRIAPKIPNSVTNMYHTFYGCEELVRKPTIPDTVTTPENEIFN